MSTDGGSARGVKNLVILGALAFLGWQPGTVFYEDQICMWGRFFDKWRASFRDFSFISASSCSLSFLASFLRCSSYLSFFFPHLLVHFFAFGKQNCFKFRLVFFELFRHIWILILWSFSLRIAKSKVLYDEGLSQEYRGWLTSKWSTSKWSTSHFGLTSQL